VASEDLIKELAAFSTPTVVDAIEFFGVRPKDDGYIAGEIVCRVPELGVRIGYAATMSYRTDRPADPSGPIDFEAYMEHVLSVPGPRFLVGEDQSERPAGVVTGEINATLHKALGSVGYITNGGIRDLDAFPSLGFQAYSAFVHVSTGYGHMTGFGEPVTIQGVEIRPGDLLHADVHGICLVPPDIAADLPKACREVQAAELEALRESRSPSFSPAGYVKARERYRNRLLELRHHYQDVIRCRSHSSIQEAKNSS